MQWSDKHVVITGGSEGLGKAMAELWLSLGSHVTVLDIHPPQTNEEDDQQPDFFSLDLKNSESIKNFEPINSIDCLICNAGISWSGDYVESNEMKDLELFQVNCLGHMELVRHCLKHSWINPEGYLGFVLSAAVYLPFPIALAYNASKGGLCGFSMGLEAYLKADAISVSRIFPGPMKTNHAEKYYAHFNEGKGAAPDKIAQNIIRGISKRKRQIYPDLVSKLTRWGSILAPGYFNGIMARKYQHAFNSAQTIDAES